MTVIPHFDLPFRFAGSQAAVIEQDSIEEIAGCVGAILACPLGFRVELPEFGVPDLVFQQQPIALAEARTQVEEWEPRAAVLFSQSPDALDAAVARVRASVSIRTEE